MRCDPLAFRQFMNSGHDDPFAFVQTIRYRRRSVRMQTGYFDPSACDRPVLSVNPHVTRLVAVAEQS